MSTTLYTQEMCHKVEDMVVSNGFNEFLSDDNL